MVDMLLENALPPWNGFIAMFDDVSLLLCYYDVFMVLHLVYGSCDAVGPNYRVLRIFY